MRFPWIALVVLCVASLAGASLQAAPPARDTGFHMPRPTRAQPSLIQVRADCNERGLQHIERGGGQSFDDRWPWGGIEISAYSGLYPVFFAASQGIDVGIPVLPWVSVVLKAEVTAGLLLTGAIFDFGMRGHVDFSDRFAIYGEVTGRFGIGELTIAEIFEDAFRDVVKAGVNNVSGFGIGLAAGIEYGGRHARFFAGLHYSALFVDASAFVDNFAFDLPTITINHFGFQVGIRFYLG